MRQDPRLLYCFILQRVNSSGKRKAANPRKHQPFLTRVTNVEHWEDWNTTSENRDKTQTSWWPWSSLSVPEGSSCWIWNWMGFKACLPNSAVPITANSRAGKALLLFLPKHTPSSLRHCAASWTNKPSWGGNTARTQLPLSQPHSHHWPWQEWSHRAQNSPSRAPFCSLWGCLWAQSGLFAPLKELQNWARPGIHQPSPAQHSSVPQALF